MTSLDTYSIKISSPVIIILLEDEGFVVDDALCSEDDTPVEPPALCVEAVDPASVLFFDELLASGIVLYPFLRATSPVKCCES